MASITLIRPRIRAVAVDGPLPRGENRGVASGFVTDESSVPARREGGAATRVTIDRAAGSARLEQRILRLGERRVVRRAPEGRHELLYVVSGGGRLHADGESHRLESGTGAFLLAGEEYELKGEGPDELVLVSVTTPAEVDGGRRAVTVRYADRPALGAGKDREFRYLVNEDVGCRDVTQFVGTIPPGRAPF